jgi:hypothetical protein
MSVHTPLVSHITQTIHITESFCSERAEAEAGNEIRKVSPGLECSRIKEVAYTNP